MSGTRSISAFCACDSAKSLTGHVAAGLIAVFAVLTGSEPASALSKEQAIENCRQTVGSPIVRACMQGMGKGGDREANLATCRAGVLPKMKACVIAALNAANGRANVAIELYKNGKPKADAVAPGNALPAGFVAPPRTIADITAILDSEKPHPATLAKLKASADNEPGKNISQADLAEFYIDRGTARSALGRNMEALADGEKALASALASGDGYFGQRIRQFITLQKLALGDIKGALQISQFMIKDANRPGQKGYLFNAQRIAANILVQMGDIPQAEGYMRQSLALFREAEAAYAKSREWRLAWIPDMKYMEHAPPEGQVRGAADGDLLSVGRTKAKQGRLAEAEVDV